MARANGEGSISRRTDGRFMVRVTDPATGKRRTAYAASESEARRVLRTMQNRAESGAPVLDVRGTVAAFAEVWLSDRAARRRSASTVREYRRRLETYVLPRLGRAKVSALTVVDVEDVLDAMALSGLSDSTIKGTRNALAAMLSDAVRARLLAVNVASSARLPETSRRPAARVVPTSDQVLRLIEETAGTDLGALVVLLAGTGARVGEGLAATWSDVDLARGKWFIGRTVTLDAAGSAVLGSRTKTGDAREVDLLADHVEALRAQRTRVASARLAAGPLWVDHDLVFPSAVGTVRDPHNVRHELRRAAPWFPGSFHGLRHAFATQAVSTLPNDTAVARALGHRKTATTRDVYTHLRNQDFRLVAEAVAAELAAARARR
ncbi:MAG: tyrosine-type recombinase/integrase [Candidatus Nanopelagicales bacterium]